MQVAFQINRLGKKLWNATLSLATYGVNQNRAVFKISRIPAVIPNVAGIDYQLTWSRFRRARPRDQRPGFPRTNLESSFKFISEIWSFVVDDVPGKVNYLPTVVSERDVLIPCIACQEIDAMVLWRSHDLNRSWCWWHWSGRRRKCSWH